MTSIRRGRPPGRLVDPTPPDGATFHSEVRIGWLLRSWRLAVRPESSARTFAQTLTELGRSADASRVSRWETGQLPVPLDVVAAYKRALGMVPGALAAIAVGMRRLPSATDDVVGLPVHQFSVADLERVLDVVVDGAPTGSDWFELALLVASRPEQVTLPMSVWQTLTATLVKQLGLSVSEAYITRIEAAVLLHEHPRAKQALVRSIGEYVIHPESLLVVDPLSLLTDLTDPPAGDLVLRLLEQQPPGPALNGAMWAASAKATRGHFDADQLRRLERAVAGIVERVGLHAGGIFNRLSDLVAVLPDDARRRLGATVLAGEAAPAPRSEPVTPWDRAEVRRISGSLAEMGDADDDPLLERLLEEAVFHPDTERRFQAALTVTFSPHRDRLGATCGSMIDRHLRGVAVLPPVVAERVMALLTFVGHEQQRPLLNRVIEEGPDQLRGSALVAVAHLPPSEPQPEQRPELMPLLTGDDEELVRRAMYCAGMTGDPCLVELERDPGVAEWVRHSAAWWRREGPALHEHGAGRSDRPGT